MERDESTGHKMGRNVTNPPPLRDESAGHKRDLHPRVTHPPQLPVLVLGGSPSTSHSKFRNYSSDSGATAAACVAPLLRLEQADGERRCDLRCHYRCFP